MTFLDVPATARLVETLGATLLHSLWQGGVVAVLTWLSLSALRKATPAARCRAAALCLCLLAALPAATFAILWARSGIPAARIASEPAAEDEPAIAAGSAAREASRGGVRQPQSPEAARLAPPPLPPRARWQVAPVFQWAVAAWLAGVLVLSLRLLGGWAALVSLRSRSRLVISEPVRQMLRALLIRLRISRPVRVLESVLIDVPAAAGWLRPVILLPSSALLGLRPEDLELLLAHELAHLRRHDWLSHLLQHVVETLLFYHPAAWWISKRIDLEREQACDDLVIEACGQRLAYARTLARLEELRSADSRAAPLTLAASGGSLLARIRRIAGLPAAGPDRFSLGLAGALALSIAAGVVLAAPGRLGDKPAGAPAGAPVASDKDAARSPARAAIDAGLDWLARHQESDGSWSTDRFGERCREGTRCTGRGSRKHDVGLTGLGLLAFLDAARAEHPAAQKALGWLLAKQERDGCFGAKEGEFMYGHAIAAQAMAVAALKSDAADRRASVQKAVDFIVKAQNPGYGWRYSVRPGDNDTSVTSWCVRALAAAGEAKIEFPDACYDGVREWLKRVTSARHVVGYESPGDAGSTIPGVNQAWRPHPTMSAAALVLKTIMNRQPNDPEVESWAQAVVKDLPVWNQQEKSVDYYYWHYAALALSRFDAPAGPAWKETRGAIEKSLLPNQEKSGCAAGSWSPEVDRWSPIGGRVYATALNVLTLCVTEGPRRS